MNARQFQQSFLSKAGPNVETLRQIADILPNVFFNITDCENRLVALNRANCENCNVKNEYELVGRRIDEAFPSVLAEAYISLYEEARRTRSPIRNRVCTHAADRSSDLRIANVFPILDAQGDVIGTAVFYLPFELVGIPPEWYGPLRKAIRHIDDHYAEKLTLPSLAKLVGMSPSTFRRTFSLIMKISPGEYVSTIRLNNARKLLSSTSLKLGQIAAQCGFYDESHLIRTFRRFRHQTPAEYRKSHYRRP